MCARSFTAGMRAHVFEVLFAMCHLLCLLCAMYFIWSVSFLFAVFSFSLHRFLSISSMFFI